MVLTLQGKVHDAGIQGVHLRMNITVNTEDLHWWWWWLLLMMWWWWLFDEVGCRVEWGCLSRSRRCRCYPGLSVELQLELMVNRKTLQRQNRLRRRKLRIQWFPPAALRPICNQLV